MPFGKAPAYSHQAPRSFIERTVFLWVYLPFYMLTTVVNQTAGFRLTFDKPSSCFFPEEKSISCNCPANQTAMPHSDFVQESDSLLSLWSGLLMKIMSTLGPLNVMPIHNLCTDLYTGVLPRIINTNRSCKKCSLLGVKQVHAVSLCFNLPYNLQRRKASYPFQKFEEVTVISKFEQMICMGT